MANGSISDAHTAVPLPWMLSQQSGKPPIPSNRLPSVAPSGRYAAILPNIQRQNGSAMEFPSALYFGASASLCTRPFSSVQSPMPTHPSGKPCKRVHSNGVNRRTTMFCRTVLFRFRLCPPLSFACSVPFISPPSRKFRQSTAHTRSVPPLKSRCLQLLATFPSR